MTDWSVSDKIKELGQVYNERQPTLRDQLAMAALLQGLMTDKDIGPDEACRVAYEVADEMLEARK